MLGQVKNNRMEKKDETDTKWSVKFSILQIIWMAIIIFHHATFK